MKEERKLSHQEGQPRIVSRRLFVVTLAVVAILHIPLVRWVWHRFRSHPERSFTFRGPFSRNDRIFFPEVAGNGFPMRPLNVEFGNNDIAVWYASLSRNRGRLVAEVTMYDELGKVLVKSDRVFETGWTEGSAFDGETVRFQIDKGVIAGATQLIVLFRDLS